LSLDLLAFGASLVCNLLYSVPFFTQFNFCIVGAAAPPVLSKKSLIFILFCVCFCSPKNWAAFM
jgi:hypothetical protein